MYPCFGLPRMVVKSDKPDPTVQPAPAAEKSVPNGGMEEPDDQISTEGSSPVKQTEADHRATNDVRS